MNEKVDQFREVLTRAGGRDLVSTSRVDCGVLELETGGRAVEVSLFYEGEGDRLVVKLDRKKGVFQVLRFSSGYPSVVCRRTFAERLGNRVVVSFCPEWIEVRENGNYLGSSFIEGEVSGYLRIPGERNGITSPENLHIKALDSSFHAAFFGDGFTGGNWPHVDYWMYPDLLLGGKTPFLNAGISAANTRKILGVAKALSKKSYFFETVVLMAGVDDVIDGIPENESRENYRAIVNCLEPKCGQLVLCSLTPRSDYLLEGILSYNRFIEDLAGEAKLPFVDIYSAFSADARRESLISLGDFPNAEGQKLIAACLEPYFSGNARSDLRKDFAVRPPFSQLTLRAGQKLQGLADRIRF